MAHLTALLDLESVDPADTTDVQTHYISDKKYGTGSGDTPASTGFLPIMSNPPRPRVVELGGGASASGGSAPKNITIELQKYVAGNDTSRLAFLDGRNILGRSAYLRYVGTGGDGTAYTLDSPAGVARGKVVAPIQETPRSLTITIRPHQRAHQVQLPRHRLLGYPHGLRGNGNTSEAEVPYNLVPTAFTLIALVLVPRVWTVGATDHQTVFGQDSVHSYFEETGTNERRLMLDVRNAADSAWHTLTGSAFDPDEDVHFMTWRFDTSTLATRFGLDSVFEDIAAPADFGALVGNWKLGRLLTSTTDVSDTIMGATALFGSWLTDSEVIDIISGRMSGDEEGDLKFFHPGEATGGVLFDYAATNADSPLDATITDAVEAPMFTGTAQLSGTAPPEISGYVQNAGLIPIDPSRKIYAIGNDVGAVFDVYDRAVPYTIEAQYSSPLELADGGPAVSGNVAASPHMGGLVQVHTEVDGVQNTADVAGRSTWGDSLILTDADRVEFGSALNSTFSGDEWALEFQGFSWDVAGDPTGSRLVFINAFLEIRSGFFPNNQNTVKIEARINISGGVMVLSTSVSRNYVLPLRVEGFNVDGTECGGRLLVAGRVVDSVLESDQLAQVGLIGSTLGHQTLGRFDSMTVLPMRLWSEAGASDEDSEALHRLYMHVNPSPSATGLAGLWRRYTTDPAVLVDETSSGFDGTIIGPDYQWGPGVGWLSAMSSSRSLLSEAGVPVTIRDSAYDAVLGASGHVFAQGQTIAQASGVILDGAGLYQVLDPDGGVIVGLQPGPATATPIATLLVEDPHPAKTDSLPPSMVRAFYGFNPTVQTSVLAGADDDRKSFAAEQWRSVDYEVPDPTAGEPNRKVYDDEDPPDGRRLEIYTGYTAKAAAKAEATRRGTIWAGPRPIRTVKVLRVLDTDGSLLGEGGGMNSLQVGEVYKIRWSEPQPVHGRTVLVEETVQLLSASQLEEQDVIVVR